MGRFVKLNKDILKHPLYKSDRLALCVYEHLLLTCSYKAVSVDGIELQKGDRLTTYKELAMEMNMDWRTIKCYVGKLIRYGLAKVHDYGAPTWKKKITVNEYSDETSNECTSDIHPMTVRHTSYDGQTYTGCTSDIHQMTVGHLSYSNRNIIDERDKSLSRERENENRFSNFQKWADANVPELAKMDNPITKKQFLELLKTTNGNAKPIRDALYDIANIKGLANKYNSVFLTARWWLQEKYGYGDRK
mgnify:FL=1